jgi:hypothetical protein
MLLTGRRPEYLTHTAGRPGEASEDAPWWPPHKIAGRHLAPYLAAHPELRESGSAAPTSADHRVKATGELLTDSRTGSGCPTAGLPRS